MSLPLLESLRAGPRAPKVVLLSDACFFVRQVSVAAGSTVESVAEQVELALEAVAPFPLTQLLYGHHWVAGETTAWVYAAYRRRFSADEVDSWAGAEWVVPTFCSLFSAKVKPGTTVLYTQGDCVTGLHWSSPSSPDRVLTQVLAPDLDETKRQEQKDALIRELGGTLHLIELSEAPSALASDRQGDVLLQAGELRCEVPEAAALAQDIRPEETLELIKKERRTNLALWRVAYGTVAALLVLLVGEIGLQAMGFVHRSNQLKVEAQRPVVEKIEGNHSMAFRIEELATKRLLPFEMITAVSEKKPRSVQFLTATAGSSSPGINALRVEAQTANPSDLSAFQTALAEHAAIEKVEVSDQVSRDRNTRFTLLVTFKPEALKPAKS